MSIKPTAWMQELPKGKGVERAVRTTTVKEVADDWKNPSPLYTADDLQDAVLAEREACAKTCEEKKSKYDERVSKSEDERDIDPEVARIAKMTCDFNAAAIRARGE